MRSVNSYQDIRTEEDEEYERDIEYKASYGEFSQEPSAIKSFKAGAEFGYNKANEWHYVKDGLPSEDGRYLVCNIFSNNYVATNIAEFNSKNGIFGCIDNSTIYAWKEIVLPGGD